MDATATEPFGPVLRAARFTAGWTQEALAERAGVSVRNIQSLEAGQNRPQRDTAQRLATALGLDEAAHARFLAAAAPASRRHSRRLTTAPPDMHAASASPPTNLPLALTSFVGREREIAEVRRLLESTRLLTLTGTGGVGKTRLALAVAAELVDQYPDGVWLVELAALAEERLVAQIVLETLGTREEPGRPLLATLTDYLREKRLLLVLDNCEHQVAACADLAEAVLRRCPGVRVLTTSREVLEVAGEHRYRVPSLTVPDLALLSPPERLTEAAAVALFVARVWERRPGFVLTTRNARAAAEVCARLDGIPLALELAAARVDSLGVEGIAARLDDRFRLLTGGPRSALPRQRTLRAALDWSYDLLGEAEQLLLDRLSVFAGGWTLTAADAMGRYEESLTLYRALGDTHGVAVSLHHLGITARQVDFARATPLLEEALALYRGLGDQAGAAAALNELAFVAYLLGAYKRAAAHFEESLALNRAVGRSVGTAYVLSRLACALERQGAYDRAAAMQEEALAHYRQLGIRRGIAWVLTALGSVVQARGAYVQAATYLREGLQISQAIGTMGVLAEALEAMAWLAGATGQAARLGGAAEALREELGAALHPVLYIGHERAVRAMRDALGKVAFTAAWAAGRDMPLEEAVALAIEDGAHA